MSEKNISGSHKQRQFWLDIARAIAIISVTMNHALSRSFLTRDNSYLDFLDMTAFESILKASLYVFSRIGVPLFLMITGSLLLKREYEQKKVFTRFLRHNCVSLFVATELWLLILYWFLQIFDGSILRTNGLLTALFRCASTLCFINTVEMTNMWYMWMILPVYLMIPVMAVGMKKLGDKLFYILAVIAIIPGMLFPNINAILYVIGQVKAIKFSISIYDLFSIYFVYVFIGYWISQGKLQKIRNTILIMFLILSFAATSFFQYWMYSNASDYYVAYDDIGVLIASASLFELIRRYEASIKHLKGLITAIARSAFAVFFIHLCIMHTMNTLIGKEVINRYPRFLLLEVCGLAGSFLIIWITVRIPFVRRRMFLMHD